MHYRLIEGYSDANMVVDGRTYPMSCLVEDDDGLRMLLTAYSAINARTWVQAHSNGALAILLAHDECVFSFITAEDFASNRSESLATGCYTVTRGWKGSIGAPSYRDMVVDNPDQPPPPRQLVNLHTHSEYSALDGLSTVQEIVDAVVADGQPALAVTDHGSCAVHPPLQEACDKAGIKPIFGIEAYFVDDRLRRGQDIFEGEVKVGTDSAEVLRNYWHLVLWAQDDEGLRNLWAMSTESHSSGFYGKPRMDWDTLDRLNKGVLASTGCLRGPLAAHLLEGREEQAQRTLGRLMHIFGDRLYVEIHSNQLEEQKRLNIALIDLAKRNGVPLLAVADSHYPTRDDQRAHDVWLACQLNKGVDEESSMFQGKQDYHVHTHADMLAALDYLPKDVVLEALANTVKLADRCTARIQGASTTPTFSKATKEWPDPVAHDVERMIDMCLTNWNRRTMGKSQSQDVYQERFEREMKLLIDKIFAGYFLIVSDYVRWAKNNGILVGPSRGSGGGSLVAYLMDITEIDPVESDLLFERFMTEGRTELPDFDIDFPTSKAKDLQGYLAQRWGQDCIVTVGTHLRLKNKGIIKKLASALKTTIPNLHYPDIELVSKIIGRAEAGTAGLGLTWEELWLQHEEELLPYRQKYPDLFGFADVLVGRLSTYGKHAAGVVISTEGSLMDRLPLRMGDDGQMITEFSMDDLTMLGYVKFDLLNLRTLDTIQMAMDLIKERHGVWVDIYNWKDEYEDPTVWADLSKGHTLGVFQVETTSGTNLTKRFKPKNTGDLADVMTLVRPGPMRSGLTETYFRRRSGAEKVTFQDERLEQVLAKTNGCLLYQEDIMQTTMVLAHYDSNMADKVRKILGKKQVEKVKAEGEKFIAAAVKYGMAEDAAAFLWAQMAEFAKYSFNRAHAFAYAIIGYWCAWLKVHYPIEFITACLSTVDDGRVSEFVTEARRMDYAILPPDINESGKGFRAVDDAVRYGLDAIKGVGDVAVSTIVANQPFISWEDFEERKTSKVDAGVVATLSEIGAFDTLVDNRRGLMGMLEVRKLSKTQNDCVFINLGKPEPERPGNSLPCDYDWKGEPVQTGRTGKPLKAKPLPKKCSRACRQYTAPPPRTWSDFGRDYTDVEVREIEQRLLGVYLSSTPFDVFPPEELENCATAEQLDDAPPGRHMFAATLTSVRQITDKNGRRMAFLSMFARTGNIDVTVFGQDWETYEKTLTPGGLYLGELKKTSGGLNLTQVLPVNVGAV